MNELYAFLDTHGLSINFLRLPAAEASAQPWYAAIVDLRYEAYGCATSVGELGHTLEEACQNCLKRIRESDCHKVVRDTTERRVAVPKPEAVIG